MPEDKEKLSERAQLVRLYEANCGIDYPSADNLNFRLAIAKKLGLSYNLREVKSATIAGPVASAPPRPAQPATRK